MQQEHKTLIFSCCWWATCTSDEQSVVTSCEEPGLKSLLWCVQASSVVVEIRRLSRCEFTVTPFVSTTLRRCTSKDTCYHLNPFCPFYSYPVVWCYWWADCRRILINMFSLKWLLVEDQSIFSVQENDTCKTVCSDWSREFRFINSNSIIFLECIQITSRHNLPKPIHTEYIFQGLLHSMSPPSFCISSWIWTHLFTNHCVKTSLCKFI